MGKVLIVEWNPARELSGLIDGFATPRGRAAASLVFLTFSQLVLDSVLARMSLF